MLRLLWRATRGGSGPPDEATSGDPASVPKAVSAAPIEPMLRCSRAGGSRERGGPRVPCLADVPAETLAAAALRVQPGRVLRLVTGSCAGCPDGRGDEVAACVETARGILEGRARGLVRDEDTGPQTLSRRALLAPWRNRPDVGVLAEPRRDAGAPVRRHDRDRAVPASRTVLLDVLRADDGTVEGLPQPMLAGPCTLCGGCVPACPTGALTLRVEDGRTAMLETDPLACIGCGDCVRACPEDALEVVTGDAVPGEGTLVRLAEAPVAGCTTCGRPLAPAETDRCTVCRTRGELAAAVAGWCPPRPRSRAAMEASAMARSEVRDDVDGSAAAALPGARLDGGGFVAAQLLGDDEPVGRRR